MEPYAHRMEIKALLTLLTDTRIVPRGGEGGVPVSHVVPRGI